MRRAMLLLLLAASTAACDDATTPAEVRAACQQDPAAACCGNEDCDQGEVCHFSVVCAQGADREIRCDPPTGDRRCHAACDAPRPCPSGQTCQSVSILSFTDTGHDASFCVATP